MQPMGRFKLLQFTFTFTSPSLHRLFTVSSPSLHRLFTFHFSVYPTRMYVRTCPPKCTMRLAIEKDRPRRAHPHTPFHISSDGLTVLSGVNPFSSVGASPDTLSTHMSEPSSHSVAKPPTRSSVLVTPLNATEYLSCREGVCRGAFRVYRGCLEVC